MFNIHTNNAIVNPAGSHISWKIGQEDNEIVIITSVYAPTHLGDWKAAMCDIIKAAIHSTYLSGCKTMCLPMNGNLANSQARGVMESMGFKYLPRVPELKPEECGYATNCLTLDIYGWINTQIALLDGDSIF